MAGRGFSDLLEDSAPALPVTCRLEVIVALAELRVCESGHRMVWWKISEATCLGNPACCLWEVPCGQP